MSDEQDSWFKSAFGVNLSDVASKVKDEATAVVNTVASTVTSVVQKVETVAANEVKAVENTVAAVTSTVAKAVSGPAAGKPKGAPGSFPLGGSVGRGGKNAAPDVSAVQAALGIAADGQCGPQTISAIEAFQRTLGQAKPDGRVDAGGATEKALSSGAKPSPAAAPSTSDSGGLLSQAQQLGGELIDKAKAVGGEVVDEAKKVGGEVVGEAKAIGGAVADDAKGLLSGAEKLASSVVPGLGGSGGGSGDGTTPPPSSDSISGKISDFLGGSGVKFDHDFQIPTKKVQALNGKVQIEVDLLVNVSGQVLLDSQDTTKFDASALAMKVGTWWSTTKADPELAKSNGLWSNLKPITTSGAALVATTECNTALGKFSITITWIGLKKVPGNDSLKAEPQVLQASASLEQVEIDLGTQEIEGLKFTGLTLRVGGQVQVGPQWTKILADMLKDQLKEKFVEWTNQLTLEASADVIISGSFIIGGVATIAGAVYQVAYGLKLQDMTENYAANLAALKVGFQAGMADGAKSADRYGQQGFMLGQQNLQKLIVRTQEQNPDKSAADVKASVVAKAADATKEAIDSGQVEMALKNGMWDSLLADGKWLFTAEDAALGFVACGLGDSPLHNDAEAKSKQWQAYLKKYPTQSKL